MKEDKRAGTKVENGVLERRKNREILLLSQKGCPGSDAARRFFEANGLDFVEIDVEDAPGALLGLGGHDAFGTPVILVGGRRLVGFDPAEVRRALGKTRIDRSSRRRERRDVL